VRGSLTVGDELVLHVQVGKDFSLRLSGIDTQVEQVDQVALINHAVTRPGSVQRLLHAGHDVIPGFLTLVVFFGDLVLANLLKQLLVLVDKEVHFADGTVYMVLGAFDLAIDFQNLNLQQLPIKRVGRGFQGGFFALEFHLLLAQVDVRLLKRGAGTVDLSQGMLDGADRRDGRYVQSNLHELAVALVEVARVPHDGRHPILNVLQHQVVLGLLHRQSGIHVADDQIVHSKTPVDVRASAKIP